MPEGRPDDIYCGLGEVPKKKRLGSAKECLKKNQVRYYGIKKVSQKLIDKQSKKKSKKKSDMSKRDKLVYKLKVLEFDLKALARKFKAEKSETKKDKIKAEFKKKKEALKIGMKAYKKLKK
jgi:hypothetical protein